MQIYWNKRKRLHKKRVQLPQDLVWDTNMAAVLLFWDTNIAAMTSCENTQFLVERFVSLSVPFFFSKKFVFCCRFVAVRYQWVVCNEDKFCVVTQRAADIRVAWLVYVRTYRLLIATLNQNNRSRVLYLGDAQIIKYGN